MLTFNDTARAFHEIQSGPNPLTQSEVLALLLKRPVRYAVLSNWLVCCGCGQTAGEIRIAGARFGAPSLAEDPGRLIDDNTWVCTEECADFYHYSAKKTAEL